MPWQGIRRLGEAGLFHHGAPYSDAFFTMFFERECMETFGKVMSGPLSFSVVCHAVSATDNSRVMVSRIIGPHKRSLTDGFLQLQSHYISKSISAVCAGRMRKGCGRCGQICPLQFSGAGASGAGYEELNDILVEKCRADLKRRLRGKGAPKSELLQEDRASFSVARHPGLTRAANDRRPPIPCPWSDSTITTTRSRCVSPIIPLWLRICGPGDAVPQG